MKKLMFFAMVMTLSAGALWAEDAYLESDGSAENGINSRYFFNPKSRIEVDYQWTATEPKQMRLFGADGVEPAVSIYINGSGQTAYGTGGKNNTPNPFKGYSNNIPVDTARHTAILDRKNAKGYFITGGVTNWTGNITAVCTNVSSRPFGILGNINNDSGSRFSIDHTAKARIYRFKIFTDDVLVHDYLPCVKGGIPGLRDQVDGVFVTGENIGVLSAGGDVETIEDDPWIAMPGNNQTSGWQSLNTGYRPTVNTRLELDYALYDNYSGALTGNGDWYVFSGRGGTSPDKFYNFFYNKNGMGWSMGGVNYQGVTTQFPTATDDKDVRRTVVFDSPNQMISVMTAGFTNYTVACDNSLNYPDFPIRLGAAQSQKTAFAPLKIYSCRFYEGDSLVRDLQPCVQDGLAGLKDSLTGEFMACGSRTYGGSIPHESGDGYIESTTRNISIDTGYYANSNTCIWADWAFTSRDNSSAAGGQHFVYEVDNNGLISRIYGNGSNGAASDTAYSWTFSKPAKWTNSGIIIVTNVRHQAYIDSYGDRVVFMTGTCTNYSTTMSAQHMTNHVAVSNSRTLKLFSNSSSGGNFALMRLYGFKIWDAGTLVRDYIPYFKDGAAGLYDLVNGTFVTSVRHALTCGGNIGSDGGAMDAYIESDGTQGVNTEYLMKGSESRVEADFAFTDTDKVGTSNNYQQRVFGQDSGGDLLTAFYITGSGVFNFGFGNTFINSHGPQTTADVRRHRAVIDGYHDRLHFITGSVTNNSYDVSGDAHNNNATWPMGIFATPNNQTATTWRNPGKMKMFSFRIYEKDVLKHEYLPYKKGSVVGLYDTVDKVVKTDVRGGNAFKISGKGVDGAERWIVSPQSVRLAKRAGTTTLSANAAGAISYRWALNGTAIAGGEDGDLTVEWKKAKSGMTETYAVTPVYDVCGAAVEGDSLTATVEHIAVETILILR